MGKLRKSLALGPMVAVLLQFQLAVMGEYVPGVHAANCSSGMFPTPPNPADGMEFGAKEVTLYSLSLPLCVSVVPVCFRLFLF